MTEIFEAAMVISFGVSWPMNIIKSLKSRTAKGKSLMFTLLIFFGYICEIISKLTSGNGLTYVFVFYVINIIMVLIDIFLYIRNCKLDTLRDGDKSIKS